MSPYNTCHTCEFRYSISANFCPGCGKRLGGSLRREREKGTCEAWDDDDSRLDRMHWYRCTCCKQTFEHVNNGGKRETFCPVCGARIAAWHDSPRTVPYTGSYIDFIELSEAGRKAMKAYINKRNKAIYSQEVRP